MKKSIVLSIIAAFLAINVNAQVDVKPKFQGGEKAFFQYFENKIQMPKKVKCKDLSYKTFCTLDIDENGKITNVTFKDAFF